MIGFMPMPADFEYRDVFLKGRPVHQPWDAFRLRHPSMEAGRRAKIFAPFDALAGFDEAVANKEVLYEFRREISEDEKEELDRRLGILHRLTWNSRLARENAVPVSVTYYVPCEDPDSAAYGYRGRYVTVSGICRGVGLRDLTVENTRIPLADIAALESGKSFDGQNIFEAWEAGAS